MQTETAENHLKFPPMLKQSLWTLLITAPGLPSEGHYYQTVNSVFVTWVKILLLWLLNSGIPIDYFHLRPLPVAGPTLTAAGGC